MQPYINQSFAQLTADLEKQVIHIVSWLSTAIHGYNVSYVVFDTSSVSNLYEIQAVTVTWSAIISYTTVDNFVRHFKRRDSETSFLEEY